MAVVRALKCVVIGFIAVIFHESNPVLQIQSSYTTVIILVNTYFLKLYSVTATIQNNNKLHFKRISDVSYICHACTINCMSAHTCICTARMLTKQGIYHCKGIYVTYHATAHCTTVLRRGEGIGPMVSMETIGCIEGRSTEGKA